jgi:hypothetical protein
VAGFIKPGFAAAVLTMHTLPESKISKKETVSMLEKTVSYLDSNVQLSSKPEDKVRLVVLIGDPNWNALEVSHKTEALLVASKGGYQIFEPLSRTILGGVADAAFMWIKPEPMKPLKLKPGAAPKPCSPVLSAAVEVVGVKMSRDRPANKKHVFGISDHLPVMFTLKIADRMHTPPLPKDT